MTTSINTNISAFFAQRNLRAAGDASQSNIGRLSSGDRIIRAADDVAGLSVGTILRTNVNTLRSAVSNANQAGTLLQIADGGLANVTEILQRQKALATQATAGSLSDTERGFLNQEFQNLADELDRLVDNTKFNQVVLLDGSLQGSTDVNRLLDTDAAATFLTNGTVPIEAFYTANSASANGALALTGDTAGTALANDEFQQVSQSILGEVGELRVIDYELGVSAELAVDIGGTTYTATIANNATEAYFEIGTGLYLEATFAGTNFTLTDQTDLNQSLLNENEILFNGNTSFTRVTEIGGFSPEGTVLQGVNGTGDLSAPYLRTDSTNRSITNFQYLGGTTGANLLSVDIGGTTYTATGVADAITDTVVLEFQNGYNSFAIDLEGIDAGGDIFTDVTYRADFIAALNESFTNAQGALNFQTGSAVTDSIGVAIGRTDTVALYNNQVLNISTVTGAQDAGAVLDAAINKVTAIRADVGALQSRFDYASANLQTAVQNQEAARSAFLDADISEESTEFASNQVLLQASISVLAQANQLPQNLLKLIG